MAEKETQFLKIKRISSDQKNIRNIATSAHIHHGKCISEDSRLVLANGSVKTARELFEGVSKNGTIYKENEDHTIFIPNERVEIFSLNKATGQIEKKTIQYVWRLVGGKTIKTRLRNGFEIETTPEHRYTVFRNGFKDVEARDLKIGDRVICARKLAKKFGKYNFYADEIPKFITLEKQIKVGNTIQIVKQKIHNSDLAFVPIKFLESGFREIVYDFTIPETHNFIAEGMSIHNTALTDNLLAASGHMAEKSAGSLEAGMTTWQHADEQERLMTVDAANVSMVHDFHGKEYLINLIDTPGHVDFGGNVTRAMRAIDGTVVLICGVEGVMPQTETVVRQALRERVKAVLFINKVDRLVKELKLNPEQISQRILALVTQFNTMVENISEAQYREKWKVNVQDGSVAFGSAR